MKKKSEITNQEVLQAVKKLDKRTQKNTDNISKLSVGLSKLTIKTDQILDAVNTFSNYVEKRFDGVENRLEKIESRVDNIEIKMPSLVTKDYLDEKLMDFKGDMIIMMRQEDKKVDGLINILEKKKVLSNTEVKQIISLKPFN